MIYKEVKCEEKMRPDFPSTFAKHPSWLEFFPSYFIEWRSFPSIITLQKDFAGIFTQSFSAFLQSILERLKQICLCFEAIHTRSLTLISQKAGSKKKYGWGRGILRNNDVSTPEKLSCFPAGFPRSSRNPNSSIVTFGKNNSCLLRC